MPGPGETPPARCLRLGQSVTQTMILYNTVCNGGGFRAFWAYLEEMCAGATGSSLAHFLHQLLTRTRLGLRLAGIKPAPGPDQERRAREQPVRPPEYGSSGSGSGGCEAFSIQILIQCRYGDSDPREWPGARMAGPAEICGPGVYLVHSAQ
jgi:hypothetical protein